MTVSLIISTYNWPEALQLCLKSVLRQCIKPEEIIIADDGSTLSTKLVIDDFRKMYPGKIKHIWHEDEGFRLAEIRNKAISQTNCDYIIQIDGDIILHRDFVKDHKKFAKKKYFVRGRRLMIGKKKSEELLKKKSISVSFLSKDVKRREHGIRIPFYSFFYKVHEEASAEAVMGSNLAFWRDNFIEVNGYNNDLTGWGAEDKELAQRFVNLGLEKRKIRYGAIQYHIYHVESDKSKHAGQITEIENLRISKNTTCKNGLRETPKDFLVYE